MFCVMIVSRVSSNCKVEEAANNGATLTVDEKKPELPEHLELVSFFFFLFIFSSDYPFPFVACMSIQIFL